MLIDAGLDSNSQFEDVGEVARMMQVDTVLEDQFDNFNTEILQNFALSSGKIYSSADIARLRRLKRPAFQTNLFHPILLRLAGDFKGNLPGIQIQGKSRDSYDKSQMMSELSDFILYTGNDIAYELAKAYLAAQIGRISFLVQDHTTRFDEEGMIDIRYYNKLLKFDTSVSDRRFDTCQFIDDASWLSPEEIIQTYAASRDKSSLAEEIYSKSIMLFGNDEKSRKLLATWAERMLNITLDYAGENVGYDSTQLAWDKHAQWHTEKGRLKVIDFYERKFFNKLTIYDRVGGSSYDVTDAIKTKETGVNWYDKNKLSWILENKIADPDPFIEEDRKLKIWQTSVCPGLYVKLYSGPQQLQNGNFKFTPILATDFHPNILETKSLIDIIKDPVKSYNHRDNTNLTYLMRSAIGGHLIEKQYTKGLEDQMNETKIAGFTVVGDGAISGKGIMERGTPPTNTALVEFQMRQVETIDKISGVPSPARGNAQFSGESAKHFNSAVVQSDIMQEWANENAQSSLVQVTKNNLWYVQNFFDEERVFKIVHNRRNPYFLTINKRVGSEILNDVSKGKYDVIISSKPFGRLAKEARKQSTMQMIELFLQANPMLVNPLLVLKTFEPDDYDEWVEWIERVMGMNEQDGYLNLLAKKMQMESGQQDLSGKKLGNQKNNRNFEAENALLSSAFGGMNQEEMVAQ